MARDADALLASLRAVLRRARRHAAADEDLARAIAAADTLEYRDAHDYPQPRTVLVDGDEMRVVRWSVEGGWADVIVGEPRIVAGHVAAERVFGEVTEDWGRA